MSVTDCVGREISLDAIILYPVRRGSRMWISRLKVQQIVAGDESRRPYISGFNTDGRRVNVHNLDMTVVIVPLGTQYESAT